MKLSEDEVRYVADLANLNLTPDEVRIPLRMHIGAPSEPAVKVGQKVSKGEVIANRPEGKLGVPVHASIDGVVAEVGSTIIRIERSK